MTNKKRLLKNKFDDAIINHMARWSILSEKRCNYVLKIADYLKLVAIGK